MKKRRRKLRLSPSLKNRLDTVVRQNRRDTVYRMIAKRNEGAVPCFVCGRHVPLKYATAEHILPKSLGGTDDVSNLSISHDRCNNLRGNNVGVSIVEQPEATK